jgi:hypothetical protein
MQSAARRGFYALGTVSRSTEVRKGETLHQPRRPRPRSAMSASRRLRPFIEGRTATRKFGGAGDLGGQDSGGVAIQLGAKLPWGQVARQRFHERGH